MQVVLGEHAKLRVDEYLHIKVRLCDGKVRLCDGKVRVREMSHYVRSAGGNNHTV